MSVKIIACEVMKEELLAIKPSKDVEFQFISMGLHIYPEKLGEELQRILDESTGYSRVILAFGLCGGAARNLKASQFSLTVPRVHDCIPILLGSKERFNSIRKEEKGTLYHTCGWINGMDGVNGEKTILSDYKRICEKYGEKKAGTLLKRIYDGYRRVLFIHTENLSRISGFERSLQIAKLLDLKHEETYGDNTYITKIVNGPWDDDDFINIPPKGRIDEAYFLPYDNVK